MTKSGAATKLTGSEIKELIVKLNNAGLNRNNQRRLARMLSDSEVFDDREAASALRSKLRSEGKKVKYTKVKIGENVHYVVKAV